MTAILAYVKNPKEQHPGLHWRTEPRMPRILDDAGPDLFYLQASSSQHRVIAWLTFLAWQSVRRQWCCERIDLHA